MKRKANSTQPPAAIGQLFSAYVSIQAATNSLFVAWQALEKAGCPYDKTLAAWRKSTVAEAEAKVAWEKAVNEYHATRTN